MYSFELLHLIYHFPHHDLPTSQDVKSCTQVAEVFSDFCNAYSENNKLIVPSCGHTQDELKQASKSLTGSWWFPSCGYTQDELRQASKSLTGSWWFPQYGCAIVHRRSSGQRRGFVGIDLIGLDHHEHEVHVGENEYQFSARAKSFATKYVGELKDSDTESFGNRLQYLFHKGSERCGSHRSATNGQGHQKTPAWIHAIALQALKCKCSGRSCECEEELSKGGFTDVGLHTGGLPRDTIFAIVRSVFQYILNISNTKGNFDVLMTQFYFYLTKTVVLKKDVDSVQIAFFMFQRCAVEATALADNGYNVHKLRIQLQQLQETIFSTVIAQDQEKIRQNRLNTDIHSHRPPSLNIPDRVSPTLGTVKTVDEVNTMTNENIGYLCSISDPTNLQDAWSWAKEQRKTYSKTSTGSVYFLRQVEKAFWHLGREQLSADDPLPVSDLSLVYDLLQWYKFVLHYGIFESIEHRDHFQEAEARMKSVELLVVWMAYCITFQSLYNHYHDILEGFAVSLRYQDLKHLLIELPEHFEAMKNICFFLQKHDHPGMAIFTKRFAETWNSPTFRLAQRYSQKFLLTVLENEKSDANYRIQKHWDEVCERKKKVETIRQNIENLEVEHREALSHYTNAKSWNYEYCQEQLQSVRKRLRAQQQSLGNALKPPQPVVQPLPKDEKKALILLFFLYMPIEFQYISELSFISQQMLVPKPCVYNCGVSDGTDSINISKSDEKGCPWHIHYDMHQKYMNYSPPEVRRSICTHVQIYMKNKPERYQPAVISLDDMDDSSIGVWYPDECDIRLAWFGGSNEWESRNTEFNPFLIKDSYTASYFTEKLHNDYDFKRLQWSLVMHPFTTSRSDSLHGNIPYSSLNSSPIWLNKEGYHDFTSIRRYPLTALRNLCNALKRNSIPLHEIPVGSLIRQTLFHVGDLSIVEDELNLEWRLDHDTIHSALLSMIPELVDTYKQRPSNYRACCVLAQICAYLAAHSPVHFSSSDKLFLLKIRNSLAQQVLDWAYEYGEKACGASPDIINSLRIKQMIFFRSATLCAIQGDMDDISLSIIIRSIIGACNLYIHGDDDSKKEQLTLRAMSEYILSNKISDYASRLRENPVLLTTALQTIIQSAPSDITWTYYLKSVVFVSDTIDGHVYSINAFKGIVLIDGLPPSQLPPSITDDDSYKKCFGSNNFEVVLKKGQYETTCPIEDCYYRFYKTNNKLVILESPSVQPGQYPNWSKALELLDAREVENWGTELPLYLKSAFSHWYSRANSILVFRDIYFGKRSPFFLHDMSKCYKIPIHERNSFDFNQSQDTRQELILLDSPMMKSFERLDNVKMIHSYIISSRPDHISFKISFLRFGLDFTLEKRIKIVCNQIQGYCLHSDQYLAGFFPGLSQYLVLQSVEGDEIKVIVPFGSIQSISSGLVKIEMVHMCDNIYSLSHANGVKERLKYFIYDLHPRFHKFTSNSISSRLYLAALYLACNSLIPGRNFEEIREERIMGVHSDFAMTGEEMAIEVLRECWCNRPLSQEESFILNNIKELCKGKYPSVSILCHDLELSTSEMTFLHNDVAQTTNAWKPEEISCEATAYYAMIERPHSRRLSLASTELCRTIGLLHQRCWRSSKILVDPYVDVNTIDLGTDHIKSLEEILLNHCQQEYRNDVKQTNHPLMPLSISSKSSLKMNVEDELVKSWKMHHLLSSVILSRTKTAHQLVKDVHAKAMSIRLKVQNDIMDVLNFGPSMENFNNSHLDAQYLFKMAKIIPTARLIDLASIALDKTVIHDFNPRLSKTSIDMIYKAVIYWLQLCVLEDKCCFLLCEHDDKAFLQEVQGPRRWSVMEHPYWLVFEAEQRIRIRHEQYTVANHLIHHTGNIVQLNMGSGKTRVVLPMIILYFCFRKQDSHIPRLCILSTLLDEACEYYQKVLCASVLGRRLFHFPFRRDVEVDREKVDLILDSIDFCERKRGFIAIAPEHRLSLELKVKEFQIADNQLGNHLAQTLRKKWLDIFDEVDEILHHRFQLVYSMGEPVRLPQGDRRWSTASDILRVFENMKLKGLYFKSYPTSPEKFSEYVITDEMNEVQFRSELTKLCLNYPPPSFHWLLLLNESKRREISVIISDQSRDPTTLELSTEHMEDVLMLRGLLSHGILLHCLKKRLRVDYGINPNGRKRLSVPFRGADSPSLRAEFSHPDCAIILTHLSYYYRGLTIDEVTTTFSILLKLGKGAKESIYEAWYDRSSKKIETENFFGIRIVHQIDLSNSAQLEMLYKAYHMNPLTINFWLRSEVFPQELDEYPRRLASNAWHLAKNDDKKVIGFSGTNDNHFLMPLQIRQYLPWDTDDPIWQKLLATNGKMLDVIIQNTKKCETFGNSHKDMSKFLSKYLSKGKIAHALIDAGAVLVGTKSYDLAKRLLPKLNDLKGVTYYDETEWKVMEHSGRILPKNMSPLHERDTFVIFDEPRCRGVDMKLRKDAMAFITVGKDMRKDKFMQAAGRMRQLDREQSLYIIGPNNIFDEIRHLMDMEVLLEKNSPEAVDVLNWVMKNTCESLAKGIPTWAENGLLFASETEATDALLDDSNDLNTLYGKRKHEEELSESIKKTKHFHLKRTGGCMMDMDLADEIEIRVQQLGQGYTIVTSSGIDQECERELEREMEKEEEEEIELPSVKPFPEEDWDYGNVFTKSTAIDACPDCLHLSDALFKIFSTSTVTEIGWSEKIYGTKNFFYTIQTQDPDSKIDNFLRIPNYYIWFPNNDMLLLSEREAQIFLMRRDEFNDTTNVSFCHCEFEMEHSSQLRIGPRKANYLDAKSRCSLKLLNGECNFPESERKQLKSMLSIAKKLNTSENRNVTDCSGNPESLSVARGKYKDFELSDLERITTELAIEADFR